MVRRPGGAARRLVHRHQPVPHHGGGPAVAVRHHPRRDQRPGRRPAPGGVRRCTSSGGAGWSATAPPTSRSLATSPTGTATCTTRRCPAARWSTRRPRRAPPSPTVRGARSTTRSPGHAGRATGRSPSSWPPARCRCSRSPACTTTAAAAPSGTGVASRRARPADVVAASHLVIGPWDHMGTHFGEGRGGRAGVRSRCYGYARRATPRLAAPRPARRARPGVPAAPGDALLAGDERWTGAPSLEQATTGERREVCVPPPARWMPRTRLHRGRAGRGPRRGIHLRPVRHAHPRSELQPRPAGSGQESQFHGQPMNNFLMSVAGDDPTNPRLVPTSTDRASSTRRGCSRMTSPSSANRNCT